ncbi:phospholipase D-like domain-containing protein [Kineosporia mesophila]|uniref:phospholipase D n=1 Tax=Kineosporia mesophila TaxID=566012 RepID=A0ABP6ZNH2_9ACTN|nr:phospholipase D-like domain-containing protein [Kineosporia mesophila]MCD5349592.1 phospholipase D-like domain-containing protein [Kineosporia mesophila]
MGIKVGGIELFMGPPALGGPDDLDEVVRDFIGGAKRSLAVAVQELDSRSVAEAVLAAQAAKIRVRLILEGDYLTETRPPGDPWAPAGDNETNRVIHSALLRSGVDVVTDLNPAIFHQKFIVRDPGEPTAAVLTGSANFTRTDTGTNDPPQSPGVVGNNLNHVAILYGRTAAKTYLAEFDRMRSGLFGATHERVEARPVEFRLGKVRVKPVFAPRQGPEMEIMKQMLKAATSIDFAMFTFAQSSGIDDAMIRLAPALDRLRGVLDRGQGVQRWSATQPLKAAGVELHQNRPGTGVRKLHHKLMVIDERLLVIGSFNYTGPATTLNDENIIVIGDLEETDAVSEEAQRRLAGYALAEIERIVRDLAEPV